MKIKVDRILLHWKMIFTLFYVYAFLFFVFSLIFSLPFMCTGKRWIGSFLLLLSQLFPLMVVWKDTNLSTCNRKWPPHLLYMLLENDKDIDFDAWTSVLSLLYSVLIQKRIILALWKMYFHFDLIALRIQKIVCKNCKGT